MRDIAGTVKGVAKSQQRGDDACGVHVTTVKLTRKAAQRAALVSTPSSLNAAATSNLSLASPPLSKGIF